LCVRYPGTTSPRLREIHGGLGFLISSGQIWCPLNGVVSSGVKITDSGFMDVQRTSLLIDVS